MAKANPLPDHLRCHRTDGRKWRCDRRVVEDKKLCEVHYLQVQLRREKKKVPDSLKIVPNHHKGEKTLEKASGIKNLEPRARKTEKTTKPMKKKRYVGVSEALDEALKKLNLKKGDIQLELMRLYLKKQVERRKKIDLEACSEGDLVKKLPNGLMSISRTLSHQEFDNVGPFCDVKVGIDSGCFLRRCFRSKNIEPLPIGTMQVVPFARNLTKLKKARRKDCHCYWKNGSQNPTKCSNCQTGLFCIKCNK